MSIWGDIDEEVDFEGLLKELASCTRLRMDLGGIASINSCGIREWVRFIQHLAPLESLRWERCSPCVVSQVNMITNFRGTAKITSVLAPFVCDPCGEERLLTVPVAFGSAPELETIECPTCGEEMEFDDVKEQFFSFIRIPSCVEVIA